MKIIWKILQHFSNAFALLKGNSASCSLMKTVHLSPVWLFSGSPFLARKTKHDGAGGERFIFFLVWSSLKIIIPSLPFRACNQTEKFTATKERRRWRRISRGKFSIIYNLSVFIWLSTWTQAEEFFYSLDELRKLLRLSSYRPGARFPANDLKNATLFVQLLSP